jgi:uncharacterized protein (DUF433 family)
MGRKRIVRSYGDVREHPRYSIEEASGYLNIPASTLKAWIRGQRYMNSHTGKEKIFAPLIEASDPINKLLSFYNLAEAHVLRSTTERNIPLTNVRKALAYVRAKIPQSHPLLTGDFLTFGKLIFLEHLGHTVNITAPQGQLAMRDILDKYLLRLEWDDTGMPIQIFPIKTNRLAINPLLSSGKPVVRGTGIMVSVLQDRAKTGETIPELAQDYGMQAFEIEEAIQEFARA